MTATQLKKQKKQQQQQQHLKDEKSNSKHVSRSRSADSTSKAVKAAAPTLAASLPIRSEPARPSPDTTSAAPDSFVKLDDVKPVLDADAIKAGRQEVWLLQLPSKLAPEELDGRRLELHGGKGQLGEGAGIIGSVSLQAGVKMDVLQHDPAMASTMVVLSGSASGRIQPLKLARRLAVVEAAEAAPAFDAYDDEEEHEQPGKADGAAAAEGGVAGVSAKKAKKRARGEEPGSGGSTPVTGGKMEHRPAGLGSGAAVRAGGGSAAKSKKRRGAGESPAEAAARGAEAREYTGSDKVKKVKKNKKKEKDKKKKRTGSGGGE